MQSCLYCIDKAKPINDICYQYSKSINRKYHTLIDLWFNKCILGKIVVLKTFNISLYMFCSFNNQQKKKTNYYIHVLVNQQFNKLPSSLITFYNIYTIWTQRLHFQPLSVRGISNHVCT